MIPLTKWLKKAPPSLKRPNSQVCLILFTFGGGVLLSSSFCGERRNPCSDSDRFLTRCRNLFLNAIYAKAAGDEVFFIWVLSFLLSDYVTLQKRFDHTILVGNTALGVGSSVFRISFPKHT